MASCVGLAARPQSANTQANLGVLAEALPKKPQHRAIKGGITWRGKPGGTPPRTTGTASTPPVADFWAARVWLRWERSLGAPCRYPVTTAEFRAHTHRRGPPPSPPPPRGRQQFKFPSEQQGRALFPDAP